MEAQLARAGRPGPQVIGIDEIAIRKGHTYRIVVSDLLRGRPIWLGGDDRSEPSMAQFYAWLGERNSARIRLAVMDMWKPFRVATQAFGQLWGYEREGWAGCFFENWRAGLKWPRLKPYEKDRPSLGRHRGLLPPGEQGLARLR